ncbi:NADP-dependent 3-hydroxy acid dehydrogenase YdfG [Frondihabitans sp. PhB188]|uniref:oxidoreductase n=1 Tax=Frondihabitans sp. PhB188 TaxID=2485200 RepID=UPI000F4727FA|nr:oxidoreductase [Frondihabitans sp. PhB188]ROQ40714.1 NADP-dependent 3-hydroxy acid dehydrogenase YdfG [Frondihabitans sp. PhB188]
MTTWLITGSSTGLGRAFAEEALAKGHNVVVTARDKGTVADLESTYPDTALAVALDVTDEGSVAAAVAAGIERFGQIDVLLNNAGYGYRAAVEEGDDADVAKLFDTHIHGTVRTIKAVLPGMRARRSGTIVNFSSIGARTTGAGSGYYGAAKAAVEQLTMALRTEVAPLGITATVVEPGGFRTDFSGRSLTESATRIADYDETSGKRRIGADTTHGTQAGDPAKAASVLVEAVDGGGLPFLLVLGSDAVPIVRKALAALESDIAAWEAKSVTTDVD